MPSNLIPFTYCRASAALKLPSPLPTKCSGLMHLACRLCFATQSRTRQLVVLPQSCQVVVSPFRELSRLLDLLGLFVGSHSIDQIDYQVRQGYQLVVILQIIRFVGSHSIDYQVCLGYLLVVILQIIRFARVIFVVGSLSIELSGLLGLLGLFGCYRLFVTQSRMRQQQGTRNFVFC